MSILAASGGMVVSPTKVGYIILATDFIGLEKKFTAKERKREKPGVVLCSSLEQLEELSTASPKVLDFYKRHWDDDILLGSILPWREEAKKMIPQDGSADLIMDRRGTSCFVIKYGTPSEKISKHLWDFENKLVFASSANPSGQGNRGRISGIGERIASFADLVIGYDEYVESIQPNASESTRYEQGVMVSFVDESGRLVDSVTDVSESQTQTYPEIIRKGLSVDEIMSNMSIFFKQWNYRHGSYY